MDNSGEMLTEKEPLLMTSPKGGAKTMPFILANGTLVNVAMYGLMPSMGLFLTEQFHVELTTASNIVYIWMAAFNLAPVIGAAISDSYFGRQNIIGLGSVLCLLGMVFLWLTTVITGLSPPACNISDSFAINNCNNSTTLQLFIVTFSLALIAIGSGCVRSSLLAFGIDQIKSSDDKSGLLMQKFFGWYYATTMFSLLFGYTFLVYFQEKMGWKIGYGISVILILLGTLCFFAGYSYFVKTEVLPNLFKELIQVLVASYKKRKIKTSLSVKNGVFVKEIIYYHGGIGNTNHHLESEIFFPSNKFRCLNKACIIKDEEQELNQEDGTAKDPWSLCKVEQVEDLKSLIRVIPIFTSGVIAFIAMSQGSFQVLQANSTNRKIIFPNFEIPAGSFTTFALLCLGLWVPLYEKGILPLITKIRGKPTYFTIKQRIGAGNFVAFVYMIVTAIVESIRRKQGNHGITMSSLWLLPQYCLLGIMEALVAIGQSEFFIGEFPKGMWSIAASLCSVEMSLANVLASFLMNTIDSLTKKGGNVSWVSTDINKGHFDYYFWVVSGLCFLNLIYYLFCSWCYGPCKGEHLRISGQGHSFLV